MCGISVVLDAAERSDLLPRLRAMHAPIAHRGPDGEGLLLAGADGTPHRFDSVADRGDGVRARLGFAFRRLRILDLSDAASQPMASPDGRQWIVFNGEIYNFDDLRRELESHGHPFRSTGDTEVILAAYRRWGTGCFERLEGMWAIVIADLERRTLVASRDRFGIKPLYWSHDDGRFSFASEAKQLVAASGKRPRGNAALAMKVLFGARVPYLYETFFEGIQTFPQASFCEISLDDPRPPQFTTYWQPQTPPLPASYEATVDHLHALLRDVVRTHSVADVRVGSLLSGGLDSSIVSSLARLPSFSLGMSAPFEDLSEFPYSRAVAAHAGLENHEARLDGEWIRANVDSAIHAMEEPPLGMAPLAQHRVFQFCREHGMTVVLDGQGADELFGGYPYHERVLTVEHLRRGHLRRAFAHVDASARKQERSRVALFSEAIRPAVRARLHRMFPRVPDWLAGGVAREEERVAYRDRGAGASLLQRQAWWDLKWGNVRIILDYADKNAMHASIEARVPYLDRRVVELALALPDSYRIANGDRKRALRDVGRRLLPSAVTERAARQGFATPDEALVGGVLRDTIVREVSDRSFTSLPLFREANLLGLLHRYRRGARCDLRAMWRLWSVARWRALFDTTF